MPLFISTLLTPDCYKHPVDKPQLIETHISWVILTGTYAYKIKKPVNFGFLDFSTLEKRHFFCQEELRLNRRLAPDMYLAVVPIVGSADKPEMDGKGNAFEYAVRMLQFPQENQLDHMLDRNELSVEHIDQIALLIARFHQDNVVADNDTPFGDPEHVYQPVDENFKQIRENINGQDHLESLEKLQHWSKNQFKALHSTFEARKRNRYIRECHGDMHLRNMVLQDNKPLVFDCIEFNPNLRWIDVINEIAFFIMDMHNRQRYQIAWRFLNIYLEQTGDYEGVVVLPFYLQYRAMVLAKVHAIRANQPSISQEQKLLEEYEFSGYLKLGLSFTETATPRLIITHGMPASGKSTLAEELSENLGAIRIRSDVERKRLFGLRPDEKSAAGVNQGIYTGDATQRTYKRLSVLANLILDTGYSVIVDATFSELEQRMLFHQLATEKLIPFIIIDLNAPPELLRQRILDRENDVSDADLAVLEEKLGTWKPLTDSEKEQTIIIDTNIDIDMPSLVSKIRTHQ
ncbi:MAG: aminoglycoside phosphotransferase [Gammaproteobacteria bacterium]|nr:MAG: aminoglycoside phosphotransferase [Gammaproteobacteria bacterium]